MKTYICIKPADIEMNFENALLAEDVEELVRYSAPLERAFREIKDWTTNNSGRVLSSFGDQILIEMNIDKMPEISNYFRDYEATNKIPFCIGIGMRPLEAYKAMEDASMTIGGNIVLYNDDIENSFDDMEEFSKAEGDSHGIDFPGLELEKDFQDTPQQEKRTANAPSNKDKIIETLMLVKQNANSIAKLKEINPKAYEAIKKVIDSMLLMAHGEHQEVQKSEGKSNLEIGIETEMAGGKSQEEAQKIASENLKKDPEYYSKSNLEKAGKVGNLNAAKIHLNLPVGIIKDNKMKVQGQDPLTGQKEPEHWVGLGSGMALGPNNHAVSANRPNSE